MKDPLLVFLIDLATNPDALAAFEGDRERALESARLTQDDRELLTTGSVEALHARLDPVRPQASSPPVYPPPVYMPPVYPPPVYPPPLYACQDTVSTFRCSTIPQDTHPAKPGQTHGTKMAAEGGKKRSKT